ncbi:hypothetical protein Bbelb_136730 [Branchiostoma belcheri]|nr:hypothetical protein Bbelb_136730 [Branchiostoma belcheri]
MDDHGLWKHMLPATEGGMMKCEQPINKTKPEGGVVRRQPRRGRVGEECCKRTEFNTPRASLSGRALRRDKREMGIIVVGRAGEVVIPTCQCDVCRGRGGQRTIEMLGPEQSLVTLRPVVSRGRGLDHQVTHLVINAIAGSNPNHRDIVPHKPTVLRGEWQNTLTGFAEHTELLN